MTPALPLSAMRPFIERDTAAGVIFWATLAVWGAIEWVPTWREARGRRTRRESWSPADQGTGALIFLMIYVGFALALFVTYRVPDAALPGDPSIWLALGILFVAAGIALRLWAIRTLGRFFTRDVRVQEGQVVIDHGPYRWVRHPSYLGGLISAAGFGVALGNWLAIPAAVIPDIVGLVRRINVEEAVLRDGLPPGAYDDFATRRARLIPGVW